VTQLNAALGTSLQFSNPSGTVLQALNRAGSANVVNSLSATTTATSLTGGSAPLPMFLDGTVAITGAQTSAGSQTTGLAARISVNSALVASPSSLVAYASGTASGDSTRPNFILNQTTTAALSFWPTTGVGSTSTPYSGTLPDYMSQIVSQQSQAANAATNLQQGQDTVVSALQQRFNDQSGVNINTEMSNLIALQNAYGANARVAIEKKPKPMQIPLQVLARRGGSVGVVIDAVLPRTGRIELDQAADDTREPAVEDTE
jgi:flagellar hook-associated protein 1 FlgK